MRALSLRRPCSHLPTMAPERCALAARQCFARRDDAQEKQMKKTMMAVVVGFAFGSMSLAAHANEHKKEDKEAKDKHDKHDDKKKEDHPKH